MTAIQHRDFFPRVVATLTHAALPYRECIRMRAVLCDVYISLKPRLH